MNKNPVDSHQDTGQLPFTTLWLYQEFNSKGRSILRESLFSAFTMLLLALLAFDVDGAEPSVSQNAGFMLGVSALFAMMPSIIRNEFIRGVAENNRFYESNQLDIRTLGSIVCIALATICVVGLSVIIFIVPSFKCSVLSTIAIVTNALNMVICTIRCIRAYVSEQKVRRARAARFFQ